MDPGQGAGRPAGQPRATCHDSSQLTMSRTRRTGPSVNGAQSCPITPICTQTRPSLLTPARPSRAGGAVGSPPGPPRRGGQLPLPRTVGPAGALRPVRPMGPAGVLRPVRVLAPVRLLGPVRPVGPAEGPPGPDHRDELGHLARERIPDQMGGAAEFDKLFRHLPGRHRHGVGMQHQPDCPRGAAFQAAAVSGRGESLSPRHPRVSHYDPSEGSRPMSDLTPFKYLRQGSPIVQRPVPSTAHGTRGRPGPRARDRSEGCGG
jgi:hypothetical protein